MSGHSKYSTIKHHKALQDAKRAKKFLNILKRISHESAENSNPEINASLKNWITLARKNNIPKANIQKAISKSKINKSEFNVSFYEGFYSGNIRFMVSCLTNNINRTNSEIKTFFKKNHAVLGHKNSCVYLFEKLFLIKTHKINNNQILTQIRDNTLLIHEDFIDDFHFFYYIFKESQEMINYFTMLQIDLTDAKLAYYPKSKLKHVSQEQIKKFAEFRRQLIHLDDVEDLWSNI